MSKTCGNCTHWDSAHSCTAPLPRWAALIINASQRHFIPAFTSATHCPCWIAAQLPRIIEQDMRCPRCGKVVPSRWNPSPNAGPYGRCLECGEPREANRSGKAGEKGEVT